jgi:hypothetical protein
LSAKAVFFCFCFCFFGFNSHFPFPFFYICKTHSDEPTELRIKFWFSDRRQCPKCGSSKIVTRIEPRGEFRGVRAYGCRRCHWETGYKFDPRRCPKYYQTADWVPREWRRQYTDVVVVPRPAKVVQLDADEPSKEDEPRDGETEPDRPAPAEGGESNDDKKNGNTDDVKQGEPNDDVKQGEPNDDKNGNTDDVKAQGPDDDKGDLVQGGPLADDSKPVPEDGDSSKLESPAAEDESGESAGREHMADKPPGEPQETAESENAENRGQDAVPQRDEC